MYNYRLLCVDDSSFATRSDDYEERVRLLRQKVGSFDRIVTWASECHVIPEKDFVTRKKSHGTTRQPQTFLKHIAKKILPTELKNDAKIELHVTTDGEIKDADITECLQYVQQISPRLAFVNVYYLGEDANTMNFGLIAVFGCVKQLRCLLEYGNTNSLQRVLTLDELQARIDEGEIFAGNIILSLVSRVKYAQVLLKTKPQPALKTQLSDIRTKILKLLDYKPSELDAAFVRECYEKNDAQRLERDIKQSLLIPSGEQRVNLRFLILSAFDSKSNMLLSNVPNQKDTVESVEERAVEIMPGAEDDVELVNIDPNAACVWIQRLAAPKELTLSQRPLCTPTGLFAILPPEECMVPVSKFDPSKGCMPAHMRFTARRSDLCQLHKLDRTAAYAKNPFALLEDRKLCENVFKHFELHNTCIETTLKLMEISPNNREFRSFFTKATCRMFIVDPCDASAIDSNCFAIDGLFAEDGGDAQFIYRNKFVWNFVLLHLLRTNMWRIGSEDKLDFLDVRGLTQKLEDALQKFYFSESFLYPPTLHVTIPQPPFKVDLPLYIVMWYLCYVTPSQVENTPRNVLRLPGMRSLFNLYKRYGRRPDLISKAQLTFLETRVKVWQLWSAMIERRDEEELEFEARSSFQNYVKLEGRTALLSGPLRVGAPTYLVGFPPAIIMHLYNLATNGQGSRYEELFSAENFADGLEKPRAITLKDWHDQEEPSPFPFHVDIDLETCWASDICRVTEGPIEECECYEKRGVFFETFFMYCHEEETYPSNSSWLVLIHNRLCTNNDISPRHIQKYMEHVFEIHRDVMETYSCQEYLDTVVRHYISCR